MEAVLEGRQCDACSARFPNALLACPSCQRLVHADQLKELAGQAKAAAVAGNAAAEISHWRSALDLLPQDSQQHANVRDKVIALSNAADGGGAALAAEPAQAGNKKGKVATGLSAIGVLLMKFKGVLLLVATKLKFLLFGLTKIKTLLSMLFMMAVYFNLYGWQFAIGFVLSIYIHEIGHVAALHRLGIQASAPTFIPFVGAYVRMDQYPQTVAEDARVGLAGPVWGFFAALACALLYRFFGAPIWGALAQSGAVINLFNLIPIWVLDGGRGFNALSRSQRLMMLGVLFAAWFVTQESLLLLLLLAAAYRAFATPALEEGDQRAFFEYAFLVGGLSAIHRLNHVVPGAF